MSKEVKKLTEEEIEEAIKKAAEDAEKIRKIQRKQRPRRRIRYRTQHSAPDLCTLKDGTDFYEYAERWMGWHL